MQASVMIDSGILELHRSLVVVDTEGAVLDDGSNLGALKAGGVSGVGLTLAADVHNFYDALQSVLHWNRVMRQLSGDLFLAAKADDFPRAKREGKIAGVYGFQNGKPFEDEPGYVELFRKMGVCVSQLTYNSRTLIGDGCLEPVDAGLSVYGRKIIKEMNRVGMLVDLSHASTKTARDVLALSEQPVIISHGNPRALRDNPRNYSDEVLDALKKNGGMISPTMFSPLISESEKPQVSEYVDHLEYCIRRIGVDHVGFSTDFPKKRESTYETAYVEGGYLVLENPGTFKRSYFDWSGRFGKAQKYPWWIYPLKDYSEVPQVTAELVRRGYSERDIAKIMGQNYILQFKAVVG